jgi:hypothetical protein
VLQVVGWAEEHERSAGQTLRLSAAEFVAQCAVPDQGALGCGKRDLPFAELLRAVCGRVLQCCDERGWGEVVDRVECCAYPTPPLDERKAAPHHLARGGQTLTEDDVPPRTERPFERRTAIFQFDASLRQPNLIGHRLRSAVEPLRHLYVGQRVAPRDDFPIAARGELFARELARRLEEPIALLPPGQLGNEQRLGDERRDEVQHVEFVFNSLRADGGRRIEAAASGEDRKRLEES